MWNWRKRPLRRGGQTHGTPLEQAAEGIFRVVNSTMIRGIRMVSVERGYDPRDFTLVCFGGAGPVHAVSLLRSSISQNSLFPKDLESIVPWDCSWPTFVTTTPRPFFISFEPLNPPADSGFHALEEKAVEQMIHEGVPE